MKSEVQTEYKGEYVDIAIMSNGQLRFTLTEAGKEEIEDIMSKDIGDIAQFDALMEDHFCNGWEEVRPEELGALTSATLITNVAVRDDNGDLIECDYIYYDPLYAIRSTPEELRTMGVVFWDRHPKGDDIDD